MQTREESVPTRGALKEVVRFMGHPMVRSAHPTTIEVTTERSLTERGDCIIGIAADKGCAQLDERVKAGLRRAGSQVRIGIQVGDVSFDLSARGDPRLELSHRHDMVIRKSEFLSDRTLAVRATAAARDIPREMVRLLKDPGMSGTMTIEVV
jgi:uncharacterized protein